MKILALDTSSLAASCAWMEDGALMGEFFINASLTHSQIIMPMAESMLQSIKRNISDADIFAVSCGPGSFTGLRIGIAAVKGMATVTGRPCAAVSTLEALAWNLAAYGGVIVPVMDARRQQVYTALFQGDGHGVRRISEDCACSFEELAMRVKDLQNLVLVGDGALLCRDYFASLGRHIPIAPSALLHQRAGGVCMAAQNNITSGKLVGAGELAPYYLRAPQAERERLQREKMEKDGVK